MGFFYLTSYSTRTPSHPIPRCPKESSSPGLSVHIHTPTPTLPICIEAIALTQKGIERGHQKERIELNRNKLAGIQPNSPTPQGTRTELKRCRASRHTHTYTRPYLTCRSINSISNRVFERAHADYQEKDSSTKSMLL